MRGLATLGAAVLGLLVPATAAVVGKILASNIGNGKLTMYNPNEANWKVFAQLRGLNKNDQSNWASGDILYAGGYVYAISQCSTQNGCSGQHNTIVRFNATDGTRKAHLDARLASHTLYDMAFKKGEAEIYVTTDKGVVRVSTVSGAYLGDYWALSADWRQAEIDVSPAGNVYVMFYTRQGCGHNPSSVAEIRKCDASASTCSFSSGSAQKLGEKTWNFAYTPKEPEMISPQSMMVQDDNTIYAVERTGSGLVSSPGGGLDIVAVLDGSGSMSWAENGHGGGWKWTTALEASAVIVNALSESLPSTLRAGVSQFSNQDKSLEIYNLSTSVSKVIRSLNCTLNTGTGCTKVALQMGGTYYASALARCYFMIEGAPKRDCKLKACLFVTDGANSDNGELNNAYEGQYALYCRSRSTQMKGKCNLLAIADDMKSQGYKILAVGVMGGQIDDNAKRLLRISSCCDNSTAAKSSSAPWNCASPTNAETNQSLYTCDWYNLPSDFGVFRSQASALGKTLASKAAGSIAKVASGKVTAPNAGVHKYSIGSNGISHKHIVATSTQSNGQPLQITTDLIKASKTSSFDLYGVFKGPDAQLYATDYSFNGVLTSNVGGIVRGEAPFLGDTSDNLPTGFMLFTPGPWAPRCVVQNWPSASISANTATTLTIQAKDYAGNSCDKCGGGVADFRVTVEGKIKLNGISTVATPSFNTSYKGNSMYSSTFNAPLHLAGTYKVSVLAGSVQAGLGWHLGDSPKMVTVVAAELDPLRCQPNISGTQLQTAGVAKGVRLVSHDTYGNVRTGSGCKDQFQLVVNATDNSATVLVVTMKCAGSDDFHYEGQFNIQKKGTFVLYALAAAKQKQVARSPFALVVKSSSLSAAQTVVSVAGAKRLAPVIVKDGKRIAQPIRHLNQMNDKVRFTLAMRDAYKNIAPVSLRGANKVAVKVEITRTSGAALLSTPTVGSGVTLKAVSDSELTLTYMQDFTQPETKYDIKITLDGVAIAGSPFHFEVTTSERISIAGKTVTQYVYAYDWPTGIAILLIIIAVLCILVLLGMSGWLFQNRLHMIVKVSSYLMLQLIIIGCIICCVACIIRALDVEGRSDTLCRLRSAVPGVGFACLWGTIMLKLWRTQKVSEIGGEKRTKSFLGRIATMGANTVEGASDLTLLVRLVLLVAIEVALHVMHFVVSPPALNTLPRDMEGYQGVPPEQFCYSPKSGQFMMLGIFYHVLILVTTGYWAFKTRKANESSQESENAATKTLMNESVQMYFVIYNALIVIITCDALSTTAGIAAAPMLGLLLSFMSLLFAPMVAVLVLMLPKIYLSRGVVGSPSVANMLGERGQTSSRPGDIPLRKHQREQTVENMSYNPDDDDDDSSSDDEGIGQGPSGYGDLADPQNSAITPSKLGVAVGVVNPHARTGMEPTI